MNYLLSKLWGCVINIQRQGVRRVVRVPLKTAVVACNSVRCVSCSGVGGVQEGGEEYTVVVATV